MIVVVAFADIFMLCDSSLYNRFEQDMVGWIQDYRKYVYTLPFHSCMFMFVGDSICKNALFALSRSDVSDDAYQMINVLWESLSFMSF